LSVSCAFLIAPLPAALRSVQMFPARFVLARRGAVPIPGAYGELMNQYGAGASLRVWVRRVRGAHRPLSNAGLSTWSRPSVPHHLGGQVPATFCKYTTGAHRRNAVYWSVMGRGSVTSGVFTAWGWHRRRQGVQRREEPDPAALFKNGLQGLMKWLRSPRACRVVVPGSTSARQPDHGAHPCPKLSMAPPVKRATERGTRCRDHRCRKPASLIERFLVPGSIGGQWDRARRGVPVVAGLVAPRAAVHALSQQRSRLCADAEPAATCGKRPPRHAMTTSHLSSVRLTTPPRSRPGRRPEHAGTFSRNTDDAPLSSGTLGLRGKKVAARLQTFPIFENPCKSGGYRELGKLPGSVHHRG
jgi:hypothetical protein